MNVPGGRAASRGVVAVEKLSMWPGPGNYAYIVKILRKGDRVSILADAGGFWKVETNGVVGYVKRGEQYLKIQHETGEAPGADNQDDRLRNYNDKAAELNRRLANSKKEIARIGKAESNIISTLDETQREMNLANRRRRKLHREIRELEAHIDEATQKMAALKKRIAENETYAAERLVALYKLGWIGQLPVLVNAESMNDLFRRQAGLTRILEQDRRILGKLTRDRKRYRTLLDDLGRQKRRKSALGDELRREIQEIADKKKTRKQLLSRIQNEKSLAIASMDALKKASRELDRKIQAYYMESKKAKTKDSSRKTKPDPQAKKRTKSFTSLKGSLMMPVKGKVIGLFGKYRNKKYNVVNFRSGIDIRAEAGAPVHAVSGGKVLFSDWLKGYGNVIIIDHGNHYYTLYAHAEQLLKKKDKEVKTGEIIATVGDSGYGKGALLHFQVRHHGKSIDPMDWLKKG